MLIFGGGTTTGGSPMVIWRLLASERTGLGGYTDLDRVRSVTNDPDAASIVSAVIALAHSLRLQVVAEGVESESQLAFLRERGCDIIQGYYYSRPLPAEELARWVLEQGSCRTA